MKIKYTLILTALIFLFLPECFMLISAEQNVFFDLSAKELSELSTFYENESNILASNIYNQAKECSAKYPFYSYTLSLKCRRAILQKNINDLANIKGVDVTISNLTKKVQERLERVQDEISKLQQNKTSFPCMEWISLIDNALKESENYFEASQNSYREENYNVTLVYLTKSDFLLYKANNLLKVAKNRNNLSLRRNYSLMTKEGEKVAFSWINTADDKISLVENLKDIREDIIVIARDVLNESKQYYSEGNYYLSLMSAAEAKALTEFVLNYEKYEKYEKALVQAEKCVEGAKDSMKEIHEDTDIDAPIAELHLEMAELHFEEAKNAKTMSAIPLADIAIQEAQTAEEQIKAVVDLKNAIENPSEMPTKKYKWQYAVPILALVVLSLFILWKKRFVLK